MISVTDQLDKYLHDQHLNKIGAKIDLYKSKQINYKIWDQTFGILTRDVFERMPTISITTGKVWDQLKYF